MNKQWSLFSIGLIRVELRWELNEVCRSNAGITSWLYYLFQFFRNIYEWNEINPILLDIDLLRTCSNEPGNWTSRRFGISISINIQYWCLLSNVTARGKQKLFFLDKMTRSFDRSRFNHSIRFHYYFASLVNMIHYVFFLWEQTHRDE